VNGEKNAAVIVAHPDDEILWTGGFIIMNPDYKWHIATLCRGDDPDRAPRFYQVMKHIKAAGKMGMLDDSPEQTPLNTRQIKQTIFSLLPDMEFDLIISHNPHGEYTRHLRHEEIGKEVINLWRYKKLCSKELWLFAYEDGNKAYLPKADSNAHKIIKIPRKIWQAKYYIITEIYGFAKDSFEARTTPVEEAFWCLDKSKEFKI
jgi:LmbE family N-acetylglucosaminyl deacetylase